MQNESILSQRFPALYQQLKAHPTSETIRIEPTKTPFPTAIIQRDTQITLYSRIDPFKSVQKALSTYALSKSHYVVLFGFGLGYYCHTLLREYGHLKKIIVFVQDYDCFKAALSTLDLTEILSSKKIILLPCSLTLTEFRNQIDSTDFFSGHLTLIHHQAIFDLYENEFNKAIKLVYGGLSLEGSNLKTSIERAPSMIKATIHNLPAINQSSAWDEIIKHYSHLPVIVIAAGSTLTKHLDLLKQQQHTALIIAIDTALPMLCDAGIVPDFIITHEYADTNLNNFNTYWDQLSESILIADVCTHPATIENFKGPQYFFNSDNSFFSMFKDLFQQVKPIALFTTTTMAGLELATLFNADPIILLGVDLGYYPDQILQSTRSINIQKTAEGIYLKNGQPLIKTSDLNGNLFLQDAKLRNQHMAIKTYLEEHPSHYINATEGGVLQENVKLLSFKETIKTYLSQPIKKENLTYHQNNNSNELTQRITKFLQDLNEISLNFLNEYQKLDKTDIQKLQQFDTWLTQLPHRKILFFIQTNRTFQIKQLRNQLNENKNMQEKTHIYIEMYHIYSKIFQESIQFYKLELQEILK